MRGSVYERVPHKGQKRAWEPMELELQAVGSHSMWVLATKAGPSEERQMLITPGASLQLAGWPLWTGTVWRLVSSCELHMVRDRPVSLSDVIFPSWTCVSKLVRVSLANASSFLSWRWGITLGTALEVSYLLQIIVTPTSHCTLALCSHTEPVGLSYVICKLETLHPRAYEVGQVPWILERQNGRQNNIYWTLGINRSIS